MAANLPMAAAGEFTASVVIPAHNESAVIGRLLASLSPGIRGLQVIVACNGCTDDTAAVAAGHGATVVEVGVSSKIAALDAGDGAATAFPRIYVDADVTLTRKAVDGLIAALRSPGVLCAAPPLKVDLAGCSWPVRAYYAIWLNLPVLQYGHVGSGVYALSREGRARFERFPSIVADDLFVRNLFTRGERHVVATDPFVIRAPRTLAALLRRRIRIDLGNLELRSRPDLRNLPGGREYVAPWWHVLLKQPWLVPLAPLYAGVNALAKLAARRRLRHNGPVDWGRDETSRSASS